MKCMNRLAIATLIWLCVAVFVRTGQSQSAEKAGADWPIIGGTPGNSHYSSLRQINRANVYRLQKAWEFDTGQSGGFETTPIIVDGVLYAFTPTQQVIALDGATGKLLWKFDSAIKGTQPDRGIAYWTDGKEKRLLAGS